MRVTIALMVCLFVPTVTSNVWAEELDSSPSSKIAVVELFTSQGCSSCPPADAVLKQLATQPHPGGDVFALSFHVDYWNRLGWTDPYSNSYASRRQRAYASGFRSNRVYTPQMVVNGKYEFVGSNAIKAKSALRKALDEPAQSSIKLRVSKKETGLEIDFAVAGNSDRDVLNIALVQNAKPIAINRGENSGRRLGHVNVVRDFQVVALKDSSEGAVTLSLPDGFEASEATVIGYVQNTKTFEITGAAKATIDSTAG